MGTIASVAPKVAAMFSGLVTAIRRALVAVIAGIILALVIRVRGGARVPSQTGGWRELRIDELL